MVKKIRFTIIVTAFFVMSGCYPGIKGRVVDSVTGNPIAGVVVVAEWTTTWGLGLTHTNTYRIVETETDKVGKFRLGGVYNPFVNAPAMVVFKPGYIPWRNDRDFKVRRGRYKKVIWKDDMTYQLEPWHDGLSIELLRMFIDDGLTGANLKTTPKFFEIERRLK